MSDSVSPALPTTSGSRERASSQSAIRAPRSSRAADLAYSSFYGGALGGSAIAVFFLILDAVRGRPLFTPSLLGSALFTGTDPDTVTTVRVDLVAYFSVVHFAAFFALGAVASVLYRGSGALPGRTAALAGVLFALLTGALLVGDWLLMPGVVSVLGVFQVLAANAVTAGVMTWFIRRAHEE